MSAYIRIDFKSFNAITYINDKKACALASGKMKMFNSHKH